MYRTICTELWTDPEIKGLEVPTKLLFLYLITNPHTHLSGIFYLSEETLLKETGLKKIPYQYGIDTLSRLEKAFRDDRTETFFVVNMFEYQGQGPKNEQSAAKHLRTLHHSSLITKFLVRYPKIVPLMDGYPIDTLSQIGPSVPDPVLLTSSPNLQSNPHSKKSNGKRAICDQDGPTDKHRELARVLNVELGPEWGKFKNYCLAHDKRYANFEAAFRNWLANVNEMKGARHALH